MPVVYLFMLLFIYVTIYFIPLFPIFKKAFQALHNQLQYNNKGAKKQQLTINDNPNMNAL